MLSGPVANTNSALFYGFPEHQNINCVPPRFKLDQADSEFLLAPLLFIPDDAINLSLQVVSDPRRISHALAGGC